MINLELAHVVFAAAGAVIGGITGLIAGVWRVARIDGAIREEFKLKIDSVKDEIETKVESLVGQFQDTFSALRQKINDVELQSEKLFMSKDGFNDFRREYREDMSSLMAKIDHITARADRK